MNAARTAPARPVGRDHRVAHQVDHLAQCVADDHAHQQPEEQPPHRPQALSRRQPLDHHHGKGQHHASAEQPRGQLLVPRSLVGNGVDERPGQTEGPAPRRRIERRRATWSSPVNGPAIRAPRSANEYNRSRFPGQQVAFPTTPIRRMRNPPLTGPTSPRILTSLLTTRYIAVSAHGAPRLAGRIPPNPAKSLVGRMSLVVSS